MKFAFDDYIVDTDTLELKQGGKAVAIEPKAFNILQHLIEHRERAVSKDELLQEIWQGRIVSDAALSSAIKAARAAIGDSGSQQAMIKTVHGHGFRFIGQVVIQGAKPTARQPSELTQHIRYCRSQDGTNIAYATTGAGTPILKTGNWMSHLEFELESPLWRHWIVEISNRWSLTRYDQRGNGLSTRKPKDVSFDALVADLEAVAEHSGMKQIILFGVSAGCAQSIEFAARHPDKVKALVLYGGFPVGWKFAKNQEELEIFNAMGTLIKAGWGRDNPAFRQVFTSRFIPDATQEQADWFNELQRKTVSPEVAYELHESAGHINVKDRLEGISVPTLIMHARDDAVVPLVGGQVLASRIPNAQFVTLDSANHILLEHEPAFQRMLSEIERFIESLD